MNDAAISDLIDPAGSDLIVAYTPLAKSMAARYAGPDCSIEDLTQAAMVGLVQAARTYDPAKGSFGAWARWAIATELRPVARQRRRPPERFVGDGDLEIADAATPPVGWRVEQSDAFGALIAGLPEQEQRILELRFYHAMPWSAVAREAGLPMAEVAAAWRAAKAVLRLRLAGKDAAGSDISG